VRRRPPKGHATWSEYYRYRIERGRQRGLSPSQARGHPVRGESLASAVEREITILGPNGPTTVTVVGVKERTRASRYDNDAELLLKGKLNPRKFQRRWEGKSIGGQRLPSWQEVLTLGRLGLASFDDFYPRSP
jgi:hypothetical protein